LYFFIVHKTTLEQEHVILTTIYLAGAKTLIVGAPGREICNVLSFYTI
jgi:hypothetical protein